ncbi:MAG: TnpV protein [Blautia wexlerae]
MSKLQDIRNLVQEHAVSVSSSPGDWMDYMDTASRLYRYSFSDQLLIHAQRPDATACASLELWNEKMLRWVNRGARGIALFDETWQNTKLRYVFDISDTHMVAGGRSPYLWKMQEHQREEILTHLAEVYALEEKDAATLQDALMAVAREMVNDNLEEYLDGLEYAVEGTYLEDLDEVTIRSDFRQLATDSVYYLLSRRCGLDPMELLEEEDFMHITDYNRLSVLTFLGNAASQLSESILIDIGKTVHKISLEEARKEVEKSNERNYNNFTTLMREIKNQDAETKKKKILKMKEETIMELTYHRKGDYLFPNLTVEEEEVTIGKYGMLRRTFLKEHKNSLYQSLFLTGKLNSHLEQIEKAAQERMDSQMEKLLEKNPAPDKEADPMAWTAHMNALMATAEESILTELVYS